MTFSSIYSSQPYPPCLVGFCIQNFPVNASKWQAKKARKKREEKRSEEESDAEAGRDGDGWEKKAAFAMRQALNFPQVKQKLSWVGAQTETWGVGTGGYRGDWQTVRQTTYKQARQNHEVAPLKHASLAHCDNENDTHTCIHIHHTHIHSYSSPLPPPRLHVRHQSNFVAYFRALRRNPRIGHGNRRKCQKQHTHTHTQHTHAHIHTHTQHTYRHMWVLKKYICIKKRT